MNDSISLDISDIGQRATVKALKNTGSIRRRLLDIGLTENSMVECVGKSPWGDPAAYLIRGAVIAIRKDDCRDIIIQNIHGGKHNGAHK